ncbi:MAG: hypothetical protein ABSD20_19330 [Terriglobales bacterium]
MSPRKMDYSPGTLNSSNAKYRGWKPLVFLFLILFTIYNSNLRPIAAGDSLPTSLLPFSIILDGSITLDRFGPYLDRTVPYAPSVIHRAHGRWYSIYPLAGPMLSAPLYLPIAFIPGIHHQSPGTLVAIARIIEKVTASIWAAGTAVFLFLLLRRITSSRAAWLLALCFALGTENWAISSQAMWPHTFGGLTIVGCLYCIERWSGPELESRWYWLAGSFSACAIAIRPTNLILLPALAISLWCGHERLRRYAQVFALPVLAGTLIAAYNLAVFHSLSGWYPSKLGGSWLDGFAGILLSPGRGMLIYTPLALFALGALGSRARESRERHRQTFVAASVVSILQIAIIAGWVGWEGGYCWGPRLLTEVFPCFTVLIAIGLPSIWRSGWRLAFAGTAIYCVFIQALGVYCYPKGHWDHLPVSIIQSPGRLWDWKDNPIVRTARGGIVWEPYAIIAAAAEGGWPAGAKKLREFGIHPY